MAELTSVSVSEFKKREDVEIVQIVKNPNTSKLFAAAGNGKNFKVQGDIDTAKPVSFLYEVDEGAEAPTQEQWDNGCFVNSSEANIVASL